MAVTVRFACGCKMETDGEKPPQCETHGDRRIVWVKAERPRIVARDCAAEGPLVVTV